MCGIAGFWGSENFLPSEKLVKNCISLMHRRGPDNVSYKNFSNKNKSFVFIHSRLSIIDPVKNSNQPMEDEKGILIFNGEIYNYVELKKDLIEKGYKFKTNSDTEVLLKMLSHYKEKAMDLLDGMWAFAYYDKIDQIFYLSRDRFGEKPLYIYQNKKNIYFGSNINYIFSLSKTRQEINYTKIHNYLYGGFRTIGLQDSTFFKNIYNLKPNTFLKISKNVVVERNYWNYKKIKIDNNLTYADSKELLKTTFFETIKRRLRSDFPMSCLLSGGIDSNSIVSSSIKKMNISMKCYSIVNKEKKYDESELILDTKKRFNLDHRFINVNEDLSYSNISKIIQDGAYPLSSITLLLYSFINQAINKDGIRVVFSGIGGDELFGGYYHHQMQYLYSSQKSYKFKKIYSDWEKFIKPIVRNRGLNDFNYYKKKIKTCDHIYVANDIFPNNFIKKTKIPNIKNKFYKDVFKNHLANDIFIYNIPPQLRDLDQISMYYGIENRCPFLSKDLFELAFSFKNNYLIKGGYGKYIFRDAMQGIVNKKILKSKNKIGFNMNIQSIFNIQSEKFKQKLFQHKKLNNLVNINEINKVLSKDKINNQESHMLFSLLNISSFLEIYG